MRCRRPHISKTKSRANAAGRTISTSSRENIKADKSCSQRLKLSSKPPPCRDLGTESTQLRSCKRRGVVGLSPCVCQQRPRGFASAVAYKDCPLMKAFTVRSLRAMKAAFAMRRRDDGTCSAISRGRARVLRFGPASSPAEPSARRYRRSSPRGPWLPSTCPGQPLP
jgi:hypothetical protein